MAENMAENTTENIPESNPHPTIPLGKSGLHISPLGLGAWAWGDRVFWGYGRGYQEQDVAQAFQVSLQGGVNWIDSAEVYGLGTSERLLGRFIKELDGAGPDVVVATKWLPILRTAGNIPRSIDRRLEALDGYPISTYMIHQPWSLSTPEAEMEALAGRVKAGKIRSAGVSNFDAERMKRASDTLGTGVARLAA